MAHAHDVDLTSVHSAPLALKVAVVSGSARRFLVGDPSVQLFDVLSGPAVDGAGRAEKRCVPGEVVIDRATADALSGSVILADERGDVVRFTGLEDTVPGDPWPDLPSPGIDAATLRHFITPAVFDGILGGNARFLAEFRAAGALFVSFDTDPRDDAGTGIDATVRVAQEIVSRAGGSVFEVSTGDKGSYLFAAFGAPVAYGDDVRRAVTAAHELQQVCGDRVRIGLHSGRAFAALYSGPLWSAYTGMGDVINLAARLMTNVEPGQVLMSVAVGSALDRRFVIKALEPIRGEGARRIGPRCASWSVRRPDRASASPAIRCRWWTCEGTRGHRRRARRCGRGPGWRTRVLR